MEGGKGRQRKGRRGNEEWEGERSAFITYICTTGKLQFHNELSLYFLHDDVNTIHTVQDILHREEQQHQCTLPSIRWIDGQTERQIDE